MDLEKVADQLIGLPCAPSGHSAYGIQGTDVQVSNANITVIGRDQHTHIHYHEITDKLRNILEAVNNFRKIQQDTLGKATPGTIEWLFKCKAFRLFVDLNGELKILWGSGMPGAGKTILASLVINHLEALAKASNGQICVAYAYIRYSDQAMVTIQGILESFVKQTVERHSDCAELAQRIYEPHIKEGTRPTEEELCQLLGLFIQKKKATFYVLDALDEAPDKIRLRLLQRLSSLGARLFVTSRPLPVLDVKFPGAHPFPIAAQDHDLELHISEKISCSEHLQDLFDRGDPDFRQHLVSTVTKKAGGMFLHASLQLDALQECFTPYAAMQTLEGFPEAIEDVYQQTWTRIINSDKHQASLAKAAFTWILYANSSLTVNQLRHALATCPETYRFESARLMPEAVILAACRGLITIDKESGLVRLVHYTAKEPLRALICSVTEHPHHLLAAVCVTLLIDHGFCNKPSFEGLRDALNKHALLSYAHKAWGFHAQESLHSNVTVRLVSTFVASCGNFLLYVEDWAGYDEVAPLHLAAYYNLPLAFAGPHNPATVNGLSKGNGLTPLHFACLAGHYNATKSLLCLPNIEVNLADKQGLTALNWAVINDDEAVVELLLARPDIQVNLADSFGQTALIRAIEDNYKGRVFGLLLSHPEIQVNLAGRHGLTALIDASQSGFEAAVKLLLAHPDIQANLTTDNGSTALIGASHFGNDAVVGHLLSHPDIRVNLANRSGSTALIYASASGHEGVVRLLLARADIQVNLLDASGRAALAAAAANGHKKVVMLLLSHPYIQVKLASIYGWTALVCPSRYGHEAVANLFLTCPDIGVNPANGWPTLTCALEDDQVSVVKLLIAHPNVQVSLANCDGSTSLFWAIKAGLDDFVKLLLACPGIEVNSSNAQGLTPLRLAAFHGQTHIAKLLLAAPSIDPNLYDRNGNTAIKFAAEAGYTDIVRMLLNTPGIYTSIRSMADGHTAMSIAVANGHHEIVRLLEEFEARRADPYSPPEHLPCGDMMCSVDQEYASQEGLGYAGEESDWGWTYPTSYPTQDIYPVPQLSARAAEKRPVDPWVEEEDGSSRSRRRLM